MNNRLRCSLLMGLLLSGCVSSPAFAQQAVLALEAESDGGSLSLLTYNVAGLPEVFSSSDPEANTPLIAPLLAGYDLVQVQEDFNYHAALYAGDVHPYRSPTSGGVPLGDGLNTLSYLPFGDYERVTWDECNGTDCLTPKGFSYARHRLDEGVYLDLYNLHANAGTEAADLAARRSNLLQLLDFIEQHSAGNAIVVMGDTNTRYTRIGDNVHEFISHGFSDAWIERLRGGDYPAQGDEALTDCELQRTAPNCETIDKIFYRSSRMLTLVADDYHVEDDVFVKPDAAPLSDHYAVFARLGYALSGAWRASDLVGGPHGGPFNDLAALPESPAVRRVSLRSGRRLDQIALELSDGTILAHGGTGGGEQSLELESGEALTGLELCSGDKDGHTRVFFASLTTDRARRIQGGNRTAQCSVFTAPAGYQLSGFFGRSGAEVDKLGAIYARQ